MGWMLYFSRCTCTKVTNNNLVFECSFYEYNINKYDIGEKCID